MKPPKNFLYQVYSGLIEGVFVDCAPGLERERDLRSAIYALAPYSQQKAVSALAYLLFSARRSRPVRGRDLRADSSGADA